MSADNKYPPKNAPSDTLPLHRVRTSESRSSGHFRALKAPRSSTAPQDPQREQISFNEDGAETAPHGNVLKIKSDNFSLEFEGDPDFVRDSYALMRQHILSRLRESLTEHTTENTPPKKTDSSQGGFLWVYVCHPLYNKVHVVSRESLLLSPLGRIIDAQLLNKIYVQRSGLSRVEALIGSSKTLWSELTSEGKKRLKQASS